jgi:hypothetical protein
MLKNFKAALNPPGYQGEVAIYAEDEKGRTVFCVAARDALANVWQTKILDSQVTWQLVMTQMEKFGRVMSAKYERNPECFEASLNYPHHLHAVLTTADFHASGESFAKSEAWDAVEHCLMNAPGDGG